MGREHLPEEEMMSDLGERWLNFGERVGGPTLVLLVLMYGLYSLTQPVVNSAIEYMAIQTGLLKEMRDDLTKTRVVVELDAAERKADLLKELLLTLDRRFDGLESALHENSKILKQKETNK